MRCAVIPSPPNSTHDRPKAAALRGCPFGAARLADPLLESCDDDGSLAPPTPPTPTHSHYEDPKGGCRTDEVEVTISGVSGDFCTPKCSLFSPCPTDVPSGVTAKPQCALQDASSGKKYCALICSPSAIFDQKAADAQCGTNATCKPLQMGMGICTYDD